MGQGEGWPPGGSRVFAGCHAGSLSKVGSVVF